MRLVLIHWRYLTYRRLLYQRERSLVALRKTIGHIMFIVNYFSFILFGFFIFASAQSKIDYVLQGSDNAIKLSENDLYFLIDKNNEDKKVDVKLYYECLCPDCIQFIKTQFSSVVEKLSRYLNIHIYPYGNAKTVEKNGHIEFKCQHGPAECYGNKLHACAIDNLQNITKAVLFNACMMDFSKDRGSNDDAADRCASSMSLNSEPIKTCAKGERGIQLLKYYGEESKKANFLFVPYILINDKLNNGEDFMKDVCVQFPVPPPPCVEFILNNL